MTVRAGGTIELLDSDEFEEHRLKYGYPADVVAHAQAAVGELSALAQRHQFPFDL